MLWAAIWRASADVGAMPWAVLIPALSGVVTTVIWVTYKLHRDAVRAHDQRAADWKAAAEREQARNDEQAKQLLAVLEAVKTLGKPS